jgi:hypothetical protein
MKTKSILLLMVMVLALLPSASAAPEIPYLDVVMQSYEPYPAQPGTYITVKIKATNNGQRVASDTIFELLPTYPFSLDPNEEARRSFGALDPGDDVVLEYKVRVDDKAVLGQNKLSLRYAPDGSSWTTEDFNILVRITESILTVDDITTTPEMLLPGKEAEINVALSNLAGTALRDITVKLDLSSTELPFAPLLSTSEKKLRYLGAGETDSVIFNLVPFADADSKIYKIPMTISYTGEDGSTVTKSDLMGLRVGAEPKLQASVESLSFAPGEISVRLVNKGVIDLKFLSVKLLENENYRITSTSDEIYIGALNSDDFDSASFDVQITGSGSITIPVLVEYMDANNNEYSETFELAVDLKGVQASQPSNSPVGTIVVVLGIVGVVVYIVLMRKKKKQKH